MGGAIENGSVSVCIHQPPASSQVWRRKGNITQQGEYWPSNDAHYIDYIANPLAGKTVYIQNMLIWIFILNSPVSKFLNIVVSQLNECATVLFTSLCLLDYFLNFFCLFKFAPVLRSTSQTPHVFVFLQRLQQQSVLNKVCNLLTSTDLRYESRMSLSLAVNTSHSDNIAGPRARIY